MQINKAEPGRAIHVEPDLKQQAWQSNSLKNTKQGKLHKHQEIRVLFLVVQRKHFATSVPVQITEYLLKLTQEVLLFTFRALTFFYLTLHSFFLAREHTWDLSMLRVCDLIMILLTDAEYHSDPLKLFVFVLSTLHK